MEIWYKNHVRVAKVEFDGRICALKRERNVKVSNIKCKYLQ